MPTDSERMDWMEATGASVVSGTSDSLVPQQFSVCVLRVTGWISAPTLREAVDQAMRETRQTHPKLPSTP